MEKLCRDIVDYIMWVLIQILHRFFWLVSLIAVFQGFSRLPWSNVTNSFLKTDWVAEQPCVHGRISPKLATVEKESTSYNQFFNICHNRLTADSSLNLLLASCFQIVCIIQIEHTVSSSIETVGHVKASSQQFLSKAASKPETARHLFRLEGMDSKGIEEALKSA